MTAKEHNNMLSTLFYVKSGLVLLIGLGMGILYAGIGGIMAGVGERPDDRVMGVVFMGAGAASIVIMLMLAIFYFVTAKKLRKEEKLGRTLAIVACALSLLSFPLGTALGVYGLWFLLGDLGRSIYENAGTPSVGSDIPPPPPNSWQ